MKQLFEKFCNYMGNDAHPIFVTVIAYIVWLGIVAYCFLTGKNSRG